MSSSPRDLADGVSEDEIIAKLVRLEWEPAEARAYIRHFQVEHQLWHGTSEERQTLVRHYFRQMVAGVVIAFSGVLLTVVTFAVVAVHGGFWIGLFGFIVLGLFMMINGSSIGRNFVTNQMMPELSSKMIACEFSAACDNIR